VNRIVSNHPRSNVLHGSVISARDRPHDLAIEASHSFWLLLRQLVKERMRQQARSAEGELIKEESVKDKGEPELCFIG